MTSYIKCCEVVKSSLTFVPRRKEMDRHRKEMDRHTHNLKLRRQTYSKLRTTPKKRQICVHQIPECKYINIFSCHNFYAFSSSRRSLIKYYYKMYSTFIDFILKYI